MTRIDLTELLDLATDAARRAGDLLVETRPEEGPTVTATKSSPTDVVTAMDTASERLIVETLLGSRPHDTILGEEGASEAGTSGVRWLVDPIDGTVNFLYGLPEWAVSIAAEVDGQLAVGVVNIAPRGEMFVAVRDGGAWLGEERVHCNKDVPLERALVATGFGYASSRRAHQAEVLRSVLPRVRDIRRGGSCAVDLCSVACGRADAYYESGPQEWDLAAGVLIAREAGGRVQGLRGRPPGYELTIAAAPELFGPLHDLLASAVDGAARP
ncbi:MAG: inositol monophosphatase [Streptosporangiales bacterium]|nr:inositol monophosphatase [Streptosporangiales bacterium]